MIPGNTGKCLLLLMLLVIFTAALFPQQSKLMNLQKMVFYYSANTNEYYLAATSVDKSTRCGHFDTFNVHIILEMIDGKQITIRNEKMKIVCLGTMYNKAIVKDNIFFRFNLVIDNSASIDKNSLRFVQETLTKFVRNMPVVYEAQVIKFSDDIQVRSPFLKDKDQLVNYINEPGRQGRTALYEAVTLGVQELIDPDHRVPLQFSVVLTDGKDTVRRMKKKYFKNQIVRMCRENFIPLFIVGVTDDVDSKLLKEVTRFGMYQHIKRFPDIDRAFSLILNIIKDTYIFKIPASGEFSNLRTIYLVKERKGRRDKYDTIQDFNIH